MDHSSRTVPVAPWGSGLGTVYALKLIPPGADPLGPENVLVLSLGVTTGAAISGQSRVTAMAKSPLSGAIGAWTPTN